MQTHITRSVMAVVIVMVAGLLVGASPAIAQLERVVDPSWETPRTADGQPDLQGLWGNKTLTPMERPDAAGDRAFLTDEEVAAINQQRVVDEQAREEILALTRDLAHRPAQLGDGAGDQSTRLAAVGIAAVGVAPRHAKAGLAARAEPGRGGRQRARPGEETAR